MMRILAFTDVHADEDALAALAERSKKADVLLCSGDMSVFGMELLPVLEIMNSWNKPIYFIHGNHEDEDIFLDLADQFPNLHFVHAQEVPFETMSIFGWGGGGFAKEDPQLDAFTKQFKPKANRVILFHGPPHGTKLDYREGYNYTGCKTRRAVIERLQPFLVICGHIHENFGMQEKIGKTIVLNPGPTGKFIELNITQAKVPAKKAAKKNSANK
jgi:uncharacterized protein